MLECGQVRGDVGKGDGTGEAGDVGKCGRKCVGNPHPNTLPYTSSIPLLTSFPLMLTHFPTSVSSRVRNLRKMRNFWANFSDFKSEIYIIKCKNFNKKLEYFNARL